VNGKEHVMSGTRWVTPSFKCVQNILMNRWKEKQSSNERKRETKIQVQIILRLMICHSVCFGIESHLLMKIFLYNPKFNYCSQGWRVASSLLKGPTVICHTS
jgi:hypothetical protein